MVMVVGGIVNLNDQGVTRQQRNIKSFKIHPRFDIDTLFNDIAIVEV